MNNPIVAGPTPARYSGSCRECGGWIEQGMYVVKIGTKDKTTSHGQGPGYWIHELCGPTIERPTLSPEPDIYPEEHNDARPRIR